MKFALPLALALTVFAGACSHDKASETSNETSPASTTAAAEPSAKEGWDKVKDGTKEVASSAGESAKETGGKVVDGTKAAGHAVAEGAKDAGHAIAQGAKDTGHAIKAATCPVLGNKTTKVYYTKVNKSYNSLLNGAKAINYENRECFSNEANAKEAGYSSVK